VVINMRKIGKFEVNGKEVDVWDIDEEDLIGGICEEDGCVVNFGGYREFWCKGMEEGDYVKVENMYIGYCKVWKRWVVICYE